MKTSQELVSRLELGALHSELSALSKHEETASLDRNTVKNANAQTVVRKVNEVLSKLYEGPTHLQGEVACLDKDVSAIHDASKIRFRYDAVLAKRSNVDAVPNVLRSTTAYISAPTNLTRAEFAYHALQLFAMDPSPWPKDKETGSNGRESLLRILANKEAFIHGWKNNPNTEDGPLDITREYEYIASQEFPHTSASPGFISEVLIGNDNLNIAPDNASPDIIRAHSDATNAAAYLGIAPKQIIAALEPGVTLSVTAVMTTAGSTADTINVDTRIWVPSAAVTSAATPEAPRKPESSVFVTATGIRNDDNLRYLQGQCKRVAVSNARTQTHRELGTHPHEAIRIAAPHIAHSAQSIGRIHIISQVAKAILKLRPEAERGQDVAKLVGEQKGSRLKDEVRLAGYYQELKSQLTRAERSVLFNAVTILNQRHPLIITATEGGCDSHCFRGERGLQTVHNVHAKVRMQGGIAFPCNELENAGGKQLKAHIDNNFHVECNLLSYC
jgi:hypothetical protein